MLVLDLAGLALVLGTAVLGQGIGVWSLLVPPPPPAAPHPTHPGSGLCVPPLCQLPTCLQIMQVPIQGDLFHRPSRTATQSLGDEWGLLGKEKFSINPSLFFPTHCPCPGWLLLRSLFHRDKCAASEMRSSSVTAPKRAHSPQACVMEGIPVDVRGWECYCPAQPSRSLQVGYGAT